MADNKEEKEIDLLELGKKLWDNKIFIIKICIIGAIIGIIIAFSIPKEYTTTVILKTESSSLASGNMGALASLAGINIGNSTGGEILSTDLYPDILNSTPFIQGLLNVRVFDSKQNIDTTLFAYFKEKQKSPWWNYVMKMPGTLMGLISSKEVSLESDTIAKYSRFIPKDEMMIMEVIGNSYSISTNKKTGVTSLEVSAQSPIISAFLADTLTSYLQSYIIEQRTKKAKTNLENSEKLYEQAKKDYYIAQQNLASFVDANINVISAQYRINQEKLQNEVNIAYTVYNQMAQQVQLNKIKIQDDTPVFTIIQPAIEPLYSSKPRKKIILVAFVLLSIIGASIYILRKDLLHLLTNENSTAN